MKKFKYEEVPVSFAHCTNTSCPLQDHCLRALALKAMPADRLLVTIINPAHTHEGEDCPHFLTDKPVAFAIGFTGMRNKMTGEQYQQFRKLMISHFGEFNYYNYRKGRRPIPPETRAVIDSFLREVGASTKISYDREEKHLNWGEL